MINYISILKNNVKYEFQTLGLYQNKNKIHLIVTIRIRYRVNIQLYVMKGSKCNKRGNIETKAMATICG